MGARHVGPSISALHGCPPAVTISVRRMSASTRIYITSFRAGPRIPAKPARWPSEVALPSSGVSGLRLTRSSFRDQAVERIEVGISGEFPGRTGHWTPKPVNQEPQDCEISGLLAAGGASDDTKAGLSPSAAVQAQ